MSEKSQKEKLVSETALVTNLGIFLNGVNYSCGYAIQKHWFIKKPFYLKVYRSRSNQTEIYIRINAEYLINAYALNPLPTVDQTELIKYQKLFQRLKGLLKRKKSRRLS